MGVVPCVVPRHAFDTMLRYPVTIICRHAHGMEHGVVNAARALHRGRANYRCNHTTSVAVRNRRPTNPRPPPATGFSQTWRIPDKWTCPRVAKSPPYIYPHY